MPEEMFPRIREIEALSDYKLYAVFDSGETVIYDVGDDIRTIPDFSVLKTVPGMFENVHLDESRTSVYWSDRVDLASDTILEYGAPA